MRRFLAGGAILVTAGCSSLQGIPPNLNTEQLTVLANRDISKVFDVVNGLLDEYQKRRDENLKYSFWSNLPFIPMAMAAALYTYHGGHQTALTNVGVGAGGLAATNTFIGAGNTANVYQTAINKLVCLEELRPFATIKSDDVLGSQLQAAKAALGTAQTQLQSSVALDTETDENKEQLKNTPGLVAIRTSNIAALQTAINAAQSAINSANGEIAKEVVLPAYLASKVRRIVTFVSGGIKQQTVSYSDQLATLINGLPKATSGPSPSSPDGNKRRPLANTLLDDARATQAQTDNLLDKTTQLLLAVAGFGLTSAQTTVESCLSNN